MAQKLIGYRKREGNFTNKDTGELVKYNNLELFYTSDEEPDVKGEMCDVAKAKTDELKITGAKNIDECIGKEVYLIADLSGKSDENGRKRLNIARIVVVGK